MTVEEALNFLAQLKLNGRKHEIAEPLVKEIRERLTFLSNVGVEYLTLDRTAATLSGGNPSGFGWQRRLAPACAAFSMCLTSQALACTPAIPRGSLQR